MQGGLEIAAGQTNILQSCRSARVLSLCACLHHSTSVAYLRLDTRPSVVEICYYYWVCLGREHAAVMHV
jgi:hypothetical protein